MLPYLPMACQVFIPLLNNSVRASNTTGNTDFVKEHQDFVRLLVQSINRFKEKMRDIITEILSTIIQSLVCPLITALSQSSQIDTDGDDADVEIDVVSDEEREWTDLIKAYLLLIQSTLTHSLSPSLLSNKNRPHLEALLKALLMAATTGDDIALKKMSIQIFRGMVEEWSGKITLISPEENTQMVEFQHAFNVFIFEHLVPLFFKLPVSPNFNPADAQCSQILSEMSGIQKILVQRCGHDALSHIKGVLGLLANCSPQIIEEYCYQLLQPAQQFETFFKSYVQTLRQTSSPSV